MANYHVQRTEVPRKARMLPGVSSRGYGIHAVQRCVMHRLGIAKAAVTLQFLR